MMKFFLLFATALVLSACSLPTRAPVTPTSWMVSPVREGPPRKTLTDYWLKIGPVAVAPPFDGKSLVYRLEDARYEKDLDRKSTRLNSSHSQQSRMPSSA